MDKFCKYLKDKQPETGPIEYACDAFRETVDDGNEFYMLNLIKRPTEDDLIAVQSMDYIDDECKISREALINCYGKRIMPLIFKRFGFPVLIVKPSWNDPLGISKSLIGKGITENFDFEMIAIVRYRSKRDFIEMVYEVAHLDIHNYKDLSVNQTAVFVTEVQVPISTYIAFIAWVAIIGIVYSMLFWVIAGAAW